jgi:pimeloyl-ACP methyl ester carboxylesterase
VPRESILAFALLLAISSIGVATVTTHTGTLSDGATYLIDVPSPWNGTLLLYSHGYVFTGVPNIAVDVGDAATRAYLLANGFALAGSSYAHGGWAVQEALADQIAVLDNFQTLVGTPSRTIAWGHSLGGLITAGLIQQFPRRFNAALPMCGLLAGGVGTWNQLLDVAFAFKTLLGPGLQVVNITNPSANFNMAESLLATAQTTPQGRARIALSLALGDIPGWFNPASPEPASTDFAAQETNQFLWASQVDLAFMFFARAELESRAGGNPSWNTHVDYADQLARSANRAEVVALYNAAGLDLNTDLKTLNDAARIAANSASLHYLEQNIIFNGDIHVPVLTLHTSGDGLAPNQHENAYATVVENGSDNDLLRQTFVHRAGHCQITPAETITALTKLLQRLDTGEWPSLNPATLNTAAAGLGTLNVLFFNGMLNVVTPAFFDFSPAGFLRPFDTTNLENSQQ